MSLALLDLLERLDLLDLQVGPAAKEKKKKVEKKGPGKITQVRGEQHTSEKTHNKKKEARRKKKAE